MLKHSYSGLLVVNGLIETMAATALLLGPGGIADMGQGEQWSMHYGFAVIAVASVGIWLWPHRTNLAACTIGLGFLMLFHSSLTISLALAGDQLGGLIMHSVLATWSAAMFVLRRRWCDA